MPKIKAKPTAEIINSRHLKILATKKQEIKDSIAFVWIDEDKIGELDLQKAEAIVKELDKVDKNVAIVISPKKYGITLYDRSQIRNKDIVITVTTSALGVSFKQMREDLEQTFKEARSVKVILVNVDEMNIQ